MDNQNLLNQRITFLKNNIQEIINKCSSSSDSEFIETLNKKKKEYMLELDSALKELKLSKDKIRKEQELKRVIRINDSMVYHRVKNKSNANELMSELKKKREQAQNDFEKMTSIENEYIVKEQELCPEIPAFLFFHKDIIDIYGICPYIILNDNVKENRLNWLSNQNDKGELYKNLYNKLILKTEYNSLLNQKDDMENYFKNLHTDYLNKSQYNLLETSEEYLKEYIHSNIKTKKIKDKFKIIINNISNIVIETGLNINDYISYLYNIHIPINIRKEQENIELLCTDKFLSKIYNDKIIEYKNIIDSIENSQKYLNNTQNNLKQELYQYIYNKLHVKKKSLSYNGKYFKKWSELSDEEKLERYYAYLEYFINKYLVEPELIEENEIIPTINIVKKLITDNFKRLKFKDIKWNIKRGIIEKIIPLKFKEEDKTFYIIEKDTEQDKSVSSSCKNKKVSSTKSCINKETEKIINEELVIYIIQLKKNKKLNMNDIKNIKDNFIEIIKTKLHIKRVTVNDKIEVFKKFDDIYNIIINNDSSSCD